MAHADWIIDLGPGAGHDGGRIVFEGTPADLVAARSTLTGRTWPSTSGPDRLVANDPDPTIVTQLIEPCQRQAQPPVAPAMTGPRPVSA